MIVDISEDEIQAIRAMLDDDIAVNITSVCQALCSGGCDCWAQYDRALKAFSVLNAILGRAHS